MVVAAAAAMLAPQDAASAQELASSQADGCQRFTSSNGSGAEREALYAHATCVVARAGVAAPANGSLSREELLSILMLMSLQQSPGAHSS